MSLLASAGCITPALTETQTANTSIKVDKLFDNDGCTVYRFMADGQFRYYAKCVDSAADTAKAPVSSRATAAASKFASASVSWDESCGKGCITRQMIQSETVSARRAGP